MSGSRVTIASMEEVRVSKYNISKNRWNIALYDYTIERPTNFKTNRPKQLIHSCMNAFV